MEELDGGKVVERETGMRYRGQVRVVAANADDLAAISCYIAGSH